MGFNHDRVHHKHLPPCLWGATSYGAQLVREDITGAKLIDAVWENTDEAVIESGEEAPRQRRRDKVRDECSVM